MRAKRKHIWVALDNFGGSINEPWFVAGNFNTVTTTEERLGCQYSRGLIMDFSNIILGVGLMDAGYNGNKTT